MVSLYDLLGVRPHDDAAAIKKAYRRAIHANHPDTHPDDPDAAHRLSQIVRANAVLSDAAQRAAYDRLLAIDFRRLCATSRRSVIAETTSKIVSDAIAVAIVAMVLFGGYALFKHVPHASAMSEPGVQPVATVPPAASMPVQTVEKTAPAPSAANDPAVPTVPRDAAAPAAPEEASIPGEQNLQAGARPAAESEALAMLDEMIRLNAPVAHPSGDGDDVVGSIARSPDPAVHDARFFRRQGASSYRDGHLGTALAHLDAAIRLDPDDRDAHQDRAIVLYRMGQTSRAFADMAAAQRLARPHASGRARETSRRRSAPSD